MPVRITVLVALVLAFTGCVRRTVSGRDLDRTARPAFISRIEEKAGPRSTVFQDDSSYGAKLKRLDRKEADRRLQVKLVKGITRFEVSEGLRARTLAILPREAPWTNTVDPAQVASALESFLVEEVPANPPDYELLRPLGADAIVEFVVEDYGMRSDDGRAGAYIEGYGRMFFLDGGEVWRRPFRADQVESNSPHLDPFRVAKDPNLFRQAMYSLLDGVAQQFAADLTPPDRRAPATPPDGEEEAPPIQRERPAREQPPEGELPDPDEG